MKATNLDMKDAACLHVVHISRHLTSCPTTRSTHDAIVDAPKKNLSPPLAGKNGKSTKKSKQRRHQMHKGECGLEAEKVRGLGALFSLRSKKKLSEEK